MSRILCGIVASVEQVADGRCEPVEPGTEGVMLRSLRVVGVTALLAAGAAVAAEKKAAGPESVLPVLKQAYEQKSIEAMSGLLTADYQFHTSDVRLSDFVNGRGRAFELGALRGLFNGVKHQDGRVSPPADSLSLSYDDALASPDPEHADSTAHYQVLAVNGFVMHIRLNDEQILETSPGLHVFHVVRGDAAVLADGQSADAGRWYVRRWLENLDAVASALSGVDGDCGEQAAASGPTPATRIGIRALTNPACARLEVMLDLPGTEPATVQVLDVTGRLRNTRTVAVAAPGALKVDAGEGAKLAPGVYWVRVSQAKRQPTTRMVVVAR